MKHTLSIVFFLCTLFIVACTQRPLTNEEKVKKIGELIEANVNSLKPFSGAVLVAKDGDVIYKGAFGLGNLEKEIPNTPDSKFFIGSVTKKFTAVAILQLVEKGQLSLDDKLSKWVPEIKSANKISIHHLLSHQSGLPRDSYQDYDEDVTPSERLLSIKNDTLLFEPGVKSIYSSVGYYALTHILEEVSGTPYEVYFEQNIFNPAGMINSGVRKEREQIIDKLSVGINRAPDEFGVDDLAHARYFDSYSLGGGGALYSTVEDIYKFHVAVEMGEILSGNSVELMKKRWPLEKEPRPFNTYGWEVYDYSNSKDSFLLYDFTGRIYGYKSMYRYYKADNIVIIVLTNSEFSERAQLGRSIRSILLDRSYSIPESTPQKLQLTDAMKKHVGVYDFPSEKTTVEIKIINNKMTLTSHGDKPMYIYPSDEFTFYSDLIPLKITFEPTREELTQKLEFNHGDEFIKTIKRIEGK